MGDDKDTTGTGGIKNYVIAESPATLLSDAQIVDVPLTELSTEYFYYEDGELSLEKGEGRKVR